MRNPLLKDGPPKDRASRGGDWYNYPHLSRVVSRMEFYAKRRDSINGLRLFRSQHKN